MLGGTWFYPSRIDYIFKSGIYLTGGWGKHFIIIIITFFLGTLHLTLPFDNFIIITIIIIDGNNNKNIKRQGQMECPQEKLIFLLNLLKNKHFYFEKYCMFENFFITWWLHHLTFL